MDIPKIAIITNGRSGKENLEAYFSKVVLAYSKLTHTPLLAFVQKGDAIEVKIITNPGDTLLLPSDTPMMGQWEGEWKSDFFQFTAGMIKDFVKENPDKVYYKSQWGL